MNGMKDYGAINIIWLHRYMSMIVKPHPYQAKP